MSAFEALGPMFHGTTHPFKVGDIVEPRDPMGRAYAAQDPIIASSRASVKAATEIAATGSYKKPRVFTVEALPGAEGKPWEEPKQKFSGQPHRESGMAPNVRSSVGFKVTGEVPNIEDKAQMLVERYRKLGYTMKDGKWVEPTSGNR